jgi:hypothetical protein
MTSSGLDPATFLFVTKRLNHLRYRYRIEASRNFNTVVRGGVIELISV